jgi:hypothetical protein
LLVDLDDTRVNPVPTRRIERVHLSFELVRGPQIVVVEQRDPWGAGGFDTDVPGRGDSQRAVVAEDADG